LNKNIKKDPKTVKLFKKVLIYESVFDSLIDPAAQTVKFFLPTTKLLLQKCFNFATG